MGRLANGAPDWTERDEHHLRQLADDWLPAELIGLKLGCSEDAVYEKASELGVGIAPCYRA